jgi:hypothetical protein
MITAVSPETASKASHFFVDELIARFLCSVPIRFIRAAKDPVPILIQCMMKFIGACIQRRRVVRREVKSLVLSLSPTPTSPRELPRRRVLESCHAYSLQGVSEA